MWHWENVTMSLLFRRSAWMKNPFTLLCQPYSSGILTQGSVVAASSPGLALRQQRSDQANASVQRFWIDPPLNGEGLKSLDFGLTLRKPLERDGYETQSSFNPKSKIQNPKLFVTKQPHAKSFIQRIVPSVALLTGLAMILVGCGSPPASESQTPNSPATPISAKEVENYARAIWLIEQKRQKAYGEIQQITQKQSFSDFTCTQPNQIAALANDIEKIAVNYCNQAKKIGETQGLTMTKFNEITRNAQSSPELQQRIQNEIVRLQSKQ